MGTGSRVRAQPSCQTEGKMLSLWYPPPPPPPVWPAVSVMFATVPQTLGVSTTEKPLGIHYPVCTALKVPHAKGMRPNHFKVFWLCFSVEKQVFWRTPSHLPVDAKTT